MHLDLGSLPTPPPSDRWDIGTVLVLIFAGLSIIVMLFAVVRHHRHRPSASPYLRGEDLFCKRPPAKVVLPRKRGRGIR